MLRRRATAIALATAAALGLTYAGIRTVWSPGPSAPVARAFTLELTDNRLTAGDGVLTAVQGDTITLIVRSNRAATLHVHEYEQHIVIDLTPNAEASSRFTADRSGRFGVHFIGADGTHAEVAAIEVYPR